MGSIIDQFRSIPEPIALTEDTVSESAPRGYYSQTSLIDEFRNETPRDLPDLPSNNMQNFLRGAVVGTDNLQKTVWGAANLAAMSLGMEGAADYTMQQVLANEAEMQRLPLNTKAWEDIESADDFFTWMSGAVGQAIPSLGLSFASGGVGGILGRKALEHKVRDAIVDRVEKRLLARGFTAEEAKAGSQAYIMSPKGATFLRRATQGGAASQFQNPGFARGATIGVFGSSSIPQAGEAHLRLQEAGTFAPLTAIAAGVAGGSLELLPVLRAIDRFFPGVNRQLSQNFIRDFAKGMGIQGLLEGSTEGAQEVVQLAALAFHDPSFDMMDPENRSQIIEAFAQGAIVGVFTGGLGEVGGRLFRGAQNTKVTLPEWELNLRERLRGTRKDEAKPELAENTFLEELTGRLNKLAEDTINPAMNAVRNTFQAGIDEVNDIAPGANDQMFRWVDRILQAHDEFVEGHAPVADDTARYISEQVSWIAEQAEAMTDPEARNAFIEEHIAEIEQHLKETAAELARRGHKVADSLKTTLDGEGISFDDFAELRQQMDLANQAQRDTQDVDEAQEYYDSIQPKTPGRGVMAKDEEFLFGQTRRREIYRTPQGKKKTTEVITRGQEAVPLKTRASARGLVERLRKRYPSATDSTFEIVGNDQDGYYVQMADPMQRESLIEDEQLWQIQENARISTIRRGQKKADREARQAKVKGGRVLDVPTLAFEGRRVGQGDNQTLRESFLTVAGMMYDRGIITGADFQRMNDKFEAYFESEEKNMSLEKARRLDEEGGLTGTDFSNVRRILKEMSESARKTAFDPRQDITEEVKLEGEPSAKDDQAQLDREQRDQRKRGRVSKPQTDKRKTLAGVRKGIQKIQDKRAARKEKDEKLSKTEAKKERDRLENLREQEKKLKEEIAQEEKNRAIEIVETDIAATQEDLNKVIQAEKKLLQEKKKAPDSRAETVEDAMEAITKKHGQEVARYASTGAQQDLPVTVSQRILREAKARIDKAREGQKEGVATKGSIDRELAGLRKQRKKLQAHIKRKKAQLDGLKTAKRPKPKKITVSKDAAQARQKRIDELKRRKVDAEIAAVESDLQFEKDPDQVKALKRELASLKKEYKKLTGKEYKTPKNLVGVRSFSVKQAEELRRLEAGEEIAGIEAVPQQQTKKTAVHLPGVPKKTRDAVSALVGRAAKLLSNKVKIRVVNRTGAQQMIDQGHPHSHEVQQLIDSEYEFAILRRADGVMYVLVDDFKNVGRSTVGMLHELGHALHYDTWEQLNQRMQRKLWRAFVADVDAGRTSGRYVNMTAEQRGKMPAAKKDIKEFNEWMADQFVVWMTKRRAPRNAIEQFLETVAAKMDQLWEYVKNNAGRYGQLNETYAEFADAVAMRIRQRDPTGKNSFFLNEAANGAPLSALMAGEGRQLPAGITQEAWDRVVARLENRYPKIVESGSRMFDHMSDLYRLLLAPATSNMKALRDKGITAVEPLITVFGRDVGRAKTEKNYHQMVKKMKGHFINRYEHITAGLTERSKEALAKRMRDRDLGKPIKESEEGVEGKVLDKIVDRKEKQLRQLFEDMHAYLKLSGLPIGKQENYFPRIFNREALLNDKEKIIRHLTVKRKMSKKKALQFFVALTSSEAESAAALAELQVDELSMQATAFRNMRGRVATDPFWNDYHHTNIDYVVANYINAAVKRAEYNKAVGEQAEEGLTGGDTLSKKKWNPHGRIEGILKAAKEQGATEKELLYIKNYVDANLGMYGRDNVPDNVRRFMAGVIAYQNMRTLMFTVFASLPDLVGPAIRAGNLSKSTASIIRQMGEILGDEGKVGQASRAWGIISSVANNHIMTEYVDNHFMPKTLRKFNDGFFRITMLNSYTDFTRKAALAVGLDYIKQQAYNMHDANLSDAKRRQAERNLAELGLTDKNVNDWVKGGEKTWGGIDYTQPDADIAAADEKVSEAMVQFVDESILSPNPSQRPLMASHPGAMLLYHLKGYMFAIHETILKRLTHNFNEAVRTSDSRLDATAQLTFAAIPAVMMMALTALGIELRELVMGRDRTERMDGWEYVWTLFERAGLTGIAQLGFDFEGAGARGQNEFAAMLGPTVSQVSDLISRPPTQTIPKAIPGASQLPWLRNELRDVVGMSPADRAARRRRRKEKEAIAQREEEKAQEKAPVSTIYYQKDADVDTQARQVAAQLVAMKKENPNYKVSFNANRLGMRQGLLARTAAYYVAFAKHEGIEP